MNRESMSRESIKKDGEKQMKVLVAFRPEDTDNLFVHTLCKAIADLGVDITCSIDRFWHEEQVRYDIIHLQWPEELVGWTCNDSEAVSRLRKRIEHWRSKGAHFVYTRHNLRPHYANTLIGAAYEVVEQAADITVHMGQYSYDEFRSHYPHSCNRIIAHHLYEHTYNENLSTGEARQKLGIAQGKFVVTAFGKFRNRQEVLMVLRAWFATHLRSKYLLAPRLFPFYQHPWYKQRIKRWLSQLAYHTLIPLARLWHIRGGSNEELVSNEELPYYLAACDVVMVQRKEILNSGNIPLAFLFGKVVIGPDTGNVGPLLRQTGNPTFDPDRTESIVEALHQAHRLCAAGHGQANYRYAKQHLGLQQIGREYRAVYEEAAGFATFTSGIEA